MFSIRPVHEVDVVRDLAWRGHRGVMQYGHNVDVCSPETFVVAEASRQLVWGGS